MPVNHEAYWWDQRAEPGIDPDGDRGYLWVDRNLDVCRVLSYSKQFANPVAL